MILYIFLKILNKNKKNHYTLELNNEELSMNITVFTPTFNRAYIIEDLYKSLKRQNYFDFE